jgi:hypothetical protein
MDTVYRNFYRNCYMRTGGFIPTKPLNQIIYPGDFFQIINGEIFVLDNIFRKGLVHREEVQFGSGIRQNPAGWNFSDGISKPHSGRNTGEGPIGGQFEFSKQTLGFSQKGSFIFRSSEPESVKILNWSELEQQLIIKLTQTIYSFRELYLVTETAAPSSWTLAIAGSDKGELEIATDSENFGLVDIFGHHSARTIQSKDIEYYHRQENRKPVFFKAKKLSVQKDQLEVFIRELITDRLSSPDWFTEFFDYKFDHDPVYTIPVIENAQTSILDMLHPNQLNPDTALRYFRWVDANLDDIEKLF